MKKISILNVLTSVDDGGLEMLVYRIYRGLDRNIYKLKLVSLTPLKNNFLENDFAELGTEIYSFDFRNKGKGIKDAIHNIFQFLVFIKFLITQDVDIIHSHDFFPALVTRAGVLFSMKKLSKKRFRLFTTYHNIYYWLKPVHRKINYFLSKITNRIVCVSNSVKLNAQKEEGIPAEKFKVIYNGIDENEFRKDTDIRKSSREMLGYTDNDFVIGNVAVLSDRKGQIFLVEAFHRIIKKYPYAKLLLVGGVREHEEFYYEILKKYVHDNSLGDYVKFHAPVKDINRLYNALDLFVMPSLTEGFGLSAFEAMLNEKICLFSDIPPFLELIDDKKNGFIFKVSDSNSLFELLDYVIGNINNLGEIAKNSREHVIKKYSLNNMLREYDLLYSSGNRH